MLGCHKQLPWCWSPSNILRIILRKFDLAVVQPGDHPGVYSHNNIILILQEYLSKLNGNYTTQDPFELTHECHISKFFTPLSLFYHPTSGYCVGFYSAILSSYSKPWLCEVQVDLFLPKNFFLLESIHKFFAVGIVSNFIYIVICQKSIF